MFSRLRLAVMFYELAVMDMLIDFGNWRLPWADSLISTGFALLSTPTTQHTSKKYLDSPIRRQYDQRADTSISMKAREHMTLLVLGLERGTGLVLSVRRCNTRNRKVSI